MAFTQNEKFLSRRRILIVCAASLLGVLAVAALGFVRGRTNRLVASTFSPPIAVVPMAPQNKTDDDAIEAEIVTVRPTGFEPAAITRPRGDFLLVINNRSGLEEVNWRLDRETGGNLVEVRIAGGKLRSGNFEDLVPGSYVLTEANHPDWICRITITSR
ncbi:MAG: hypothetical protein QOG23_4297 [Blastocatellia bacterium]|jgi:hypothetical protein|nr:hypothetical protein [Blastocatellia bacterium]